MRQLADLAEESVVVFDGFADNLAKKNDSLIHYLLSNPPYDLISFNSLNVFVKEHFSPNTFSYFEGFGYNLINRSSIGQYKIMG